MASFCSGCGFPQNAGVAFCPNCGARRRPVERGAGRPTGPAKAVAAPAKSGSGLKIVLALLAFFAMAGIAA